jgi:hypothetical protein
MIRIEDLIFEQVVFEVRYEHGYLYWDNFGKIWKNLLEKYPKLKYEKVTTESAVLYWEEEDLTINFSPMVINIIQQFPRNINVIGELSDLAINIITKYLEIETFTRIGNRFNFITKLKNADESVKLLKQAGLFNVPDNILTKAGDTLKDPQVKFVITKDEEKGYIFNLAYVDRQLQLRVPKPIKVDKSSFITSGLSIDIDSYTIKPVDCAILKSHELIKKNKKDIEFLIKEIFH